MKNGHGIFVFLGLACAALCSAPYGAGPGLGAQLPAGTPIFSVNAKWVTDHGSQVFNVRGYGAVGDGITDDTVAIQSVYNLFCSDNVGTGLRGRVYFPVGTYKITSPIVSCGLGITSEGAASATGAGALLSWAGPATEPMMILYGAFQQRIRGLSFSGGAGVLYAIHLVADNAIQTTLGTAVPSPGTYTVTPGSMNSIGVGTLLGIDNGNADAELVYVTATTSSTFTAVFAKSHAATATVGGGAVTEGNLIEDVQIAQSSGSGIAIGNVLGPVNPGSSEVAETTIRHCSLNGVGTSDSGIKTLDGNNVGDNYLYGNVISAYQYGVNFSANSFSSIISGGNFQGDSVADIYDGQNGSLTVEGVYTEPGSNASFEIGAGGNTLPGNLILIGNYVAPTSSATYVVQHSGMLTMIGNRFHSANSAVKVGAATAVGNAHPNQVLSECNFYQGATTYAPIYDSGSTPALPYYLSNAPSTATSINDSGGTFGALVSLKNSVGVATLTSQMATAVGSSGILNAGDTDTAVAFRNHANSGDVNGLSKDASDVVHVGGSSGVSVAKITAAGPGVFALNSVTFSSTPTFNASAGNTQTIILNGNVTSSTLSNCAAGQWLVFDIVENATGGYTFTWPSNVHGGGSIATTANYHNRQSFYCDGTNAWSVGALQSGT